MDLSKNETCQPAKEADYSYSTKETRDLTKVQLRFPFAFSMVWADWKHVVFWKARKGSWQSSGAGTLLAAQQQGMG